MRDGAKFMEGSRRSPLAHATYNCPCYWTDFGGEIWVRRSLWALMHLCHDSLGGLYLIPFLSHMPLYRVPFALGLHFR